MFLCKINVLFIFHTEKIGYGIEDNEIRYAVSLVSRAMRKCQSELRLSQNNTKKVFIMNSSSSFEPFYIKKAKNLLKKF